MVPLSGPDPPMGSFTARRPNASNLPEFHLPQPQHPPLTGYQSKYSAYSQVNSSQSLPTSAALTSVGNLLTPPSNGSTDGLSPTSTAPGHSVQPFTSSVWPAPSTASSTPYGFQSGSTPQSFGQGRGLFSPSLNSVVHRGTSSPAASEGLPPPPYEIPQFSQSMSMPMSAPSLPALPSQPPPMNGMMGGQHTPGSASVTQASPVSTHEGFARPPPTPTGSYYSQASATPQQGSFPYSTGPSPIAQSPMSAGGHLGKMSPVHQGGPIPPLHAQSQAQYPQHRPYNYSMPVLSNVGNPNAPLALVSGPMPHAMMPPFNSGTAAQMHAMYHHPQAPHPQNDRPFRCDQCPQSFNRNHDLKRHKRIHLAVKPFPCGHCDKSFSRKDALKRHVLVKGCGKAQTTTEIKEIDGSVSPRSEDSNPRTNGA